jgi:hypothetical protein
MKPESIRPWSRTSALALLLIVAGCGRETQLNQIGSELGIRLPRYEVLRASDDYMGFDPTFIYALRFKAADFDSLVIAVRTSPTFRILPTGSFNTLSFEDQLNTLRAAHVHGTSVYWTEDDTAFIFMSLSPGFDSSDTLYKARVAEKLILRNETVETSASGAALARTMHQFITEPDSARGDSSIASPAWIMQKYSVHCYISKRRRVLEYRKGYF